MDHSGPSRKPHGFSRAERLLKRRQFDHVMQGGISARAALMRMWANENDVGYPRLGLVVSRRHGNAVVRNRLKRLAREAFRLSKRRFACGMDIVISFRDAKGCTYKDVEKDVAELAEVLRRELRL